LARDIGKKRLQFMDRRIERSKVQNSRDFKEMTFAITLLAGVSAFLSKVIGYFNNNVITFSGYSTFLIYTLVLMAITILVLLSIFLLLKWYLISIKYENKLIKNITEKTFKFISMYRGCPTITVSDKIKPGFLI
jgi:protein-S-isoprenylcysteine O-methyltransferase Ste14